MKLDPNQSAVLTVSFDPKTDWKSAGNGDDQQQCSKLSTENRIVRRRNITTEQPAVELKWEQSPSPNIVGYYVYRSMKSGGSFSRLNSQPDSGTSYTDNTVASGQSYVYVVTVVDSKDIQSRILAQSPLDPAN